MEAKTVFARSVRTARWLQKMSEAELAHCTYLALDQVQAMEQGRFVPRLWQVLLLADVLDLDRAWLCRLALAGAAHIYKEEPDGLLHQRAAAAAAGA